MKGNKNVSSIGSGDKRGDLFFVFVSKFSLNNVFELNLIRKNIKSIYDFGLGTNLNR